MSGADAAAAAHDLPLDRLADWIAARGLPLRAPLAATKFPGGQSNPTYRISDADGRLAVLRRKPSGALLASAHAVDREYRVIDALHGRGVPVAAPIALCMDEAVIGSAFYLMQHVEGRILWDPAMPGMAPAERGAHYAGIVRVLAAIHAVDPAAVGLADYGRPGDYFARQLARWSGQYQASATRAIPAMDALLAALPGRCPPDDGSAALVHGDFRLDNLLWHPSEPRVLAVLDWELSTLGHPLADLGYLCMALRLPRNPVIPGLAGEDRAALGVPDEAALRAAYAAAGGRADAADWGFVLGFGFFRLAAIAQGVAKRAEQGNASSSRAHEAGRMVELLATLGLQALAEG